MSHSRTVFWATFLPLVWLFGATALHIGASGVIFGYLGFLLARYYFDRRLSSGIIAPRAERRALPISYRATSRDDLGAFLPPIHFPYFAMCGVSRLRSFRQNCSFSVRGRGSFGRSGNVAWSWVEPSAFTASMQVALW